MKDITEIVDLPDPAAQSLVHPLDLAPARTPFRRAWLVDTLTNAAAGVSVAAVVWFATRNYVVPLLAGAAHIALGAYAARTLREQAWAFIPRKRQDRARPLPLAWELTSAVTVGALLVVAMALVAIRMDQLGLSGDVREFTIGAGAGVVLILVGELVGALWRGPGGRVRALLTVTKVLAAAGGVAIAYATVIGSAGPRTWTNVAWGAATIMVAGAAVGIRKLATAR